MIEIIIALSGGLITYYLSNKVGAVRASAGSSLVFYIALVLVSKVVTIPLDLWSLIFYGGSFVGMSSSDRANPIIIASACLAFVAFYFNVAVLLEGMGGGLGLSAFLSVLFILACKSAIFKAMTLFKS
ncbi:MAG: hypothetical protein KC478_01860 [Bacteriovoracaceae bacterium]|nr:hypothetical protein [Bacteriovoracaceae bacterium]